MEKTLINLLIIGIGAGMIYGLDRLVDHLKNRRIRKDLKYRQKDTRLAKYYGEMINDRNDGWTKNHYKNLYQQRLIEVKKKQMFHFVKEYDKLYPEKNTLWIFGGSTSTNFNGGTHPNIEINEIFGSLVAEELGMEMILAAEPALCTFANTLNFINNKEKLKEGDKIIWQIPFFDRFSLYPFTGSNWLDIAEILIPMHINTGPELVIEQLDNLKYYWLKKHVIDYIRNEISYKKIEIIFWNEEQMDHPDFEKWHSLCNFVKTPDEKSYSFYWDWMQPSNILRFEDDMHYTKEGHRQLANHFINILKNK